MRQQSRNIDSLIKVELNCLGAVVGCDHMSVWLPMQSVVPISSFDGFKYLPAMDSV
jgi:hypothetical protein